MSLNKSTTYQNGVFAHQSPLVALGGEMLSQFKFEASMNQSKLLISASLGGSSHMSSTISSIMSIKSSILGSQKINLGLKIKESKRNHQQFLFGSGKNNEAKNKLYNNQ